MRIIVCLAIVLLAPTVFGGDKVIGNDAVEFRLPSGATHEEYDIFSLAAAEKSEPKKYLSWWIFKEEELPEGESISLRGAKRVSNFAAADGIDGGSNGSPNFIESIQTLDDSKADIYKITIIGYGSSKHITGHEAGFCLIVRAKKNAPKYNYVLTMYSPSLAMLREIGRSIKLKEVAEKK